MDSGFDGKVAEQINRRRIVDRWEGPGGAAVPPAWFQTTRVGLPDFPGHLGLGNLLKAEMAWAPVGRLIIHHVLKNAEDPNGKRQGWALK